MKHLTIILFLTFVASLDAQNHWNNVGLFNGKSYVSTYSSKLNANHQSFSFEAWVKPDRDTATCSIMGKGQYTVALAGGRVFCVTNSLGQIRSKKQVQANEWVHFVITYQGGAGGAAKIYINGKIDTSISFTGTMFPTNDSFFIGRAPYAPKFSGEIDEVRVWIGARTAAEIDESYRLHLSQKGSSTLYPFLLYVQTFEDDLEMNGFVINNGNNIGNVSNRPVGLEPSTRVRHNDCIYFPGNYSWLESAVSNDSFLSFNGPITIEAWVHPTAFDTKMMIVDMTGGGNGGGYQLSMVQQGRFNFYTVGGANSNKVIAINTWYHIAIVGDKPSAGNQNFKMYVNGKLDQSFTLPLYNVNNYKIRIGASFSNSDYFKGYMDEIRIYNHSRTYEEILRDMHRPLLLSNQSAHPKNAVAYNFDGNLYSGTGKGPELTSQSVRFAKTTELASPLFSTGTTHDSTMSTYSIKHPWAAIPMTNTYGVITDTLNIAKGKKIDAARFRVFLSMFHNNPADLRVVLISPTNDSVVLVNQHNLKGKQMTGLLDASNSFRLYDNNLVEYGPAIGFDDNYSIFNNKNSKGTWTLKVYDKNFGFTGILFSWGIHIEGEDITGLNANVFDKALDLYPNPAQKGQIVQVNVQNTENSLLNIQIYDMQGRLMHSENTMSNGKTLEVQLPEQLSSGQYLIKISGTEQNVSALIIVE
ncbi:MAG TPA: LamG-like jellyroll fold domain-containing protein [Bacteroidia bacterium]